MSQKDRCTFYLYQKAVLYQKSNYEAGYAILLQQAANRKTSFPDKKLT